MVANSRLGGERTVPGAPAPPLRTLRERCGGETIVGFSATHNELSDPTRDPADDRGTAHQLLTAPVYLRTNVDPRQDYHDRRTVSADTPWFQDLVAQAKADTGARLAAVPINGNTAISWNEIPVETLTLPDGVGGETTSPGLVPNSRAAIGEKDLEALDIDAVLCGVQVQSPAQTAKRLIAYWELLAGQVDTTEAALESGWRLLAQHAISGTIQAAGRFPVSAPNILFERGDLVELAGFKHIPMTPHTGGFAGAFTSRFTETRETYERERATVRAKRTVRYLDENQTKQPTQAQYLSKFAEMYDADEEAATDAFLAAKDAGQLEYVSGRLRLVED